jgi:ATP-dependent protease HslVU (ClpYQ) peptidase subunit
MTCIIAKIHDKKVHMIADRMGSDGFLKENYPLVKKIFKNGDFIIGCTTSFRMIQILQHTWEAPKKSLDISDDKYIYKIITESIMAAFKAADFGHKKDAHYQGGNFLMGWKGRLFEVQDDMSILEYQNFSSVGCGEYHAYAAMETLNLTGMLQDEPEKFLATALKVAAHCTTGVSEDYDYIAEL